MTSLFILLASFVLAFLTTPLYKKLGEHWGIVDRPEGRHQHQGAISRLGGVGLFIGFFLTAVGLFAWLPLKPEHRLPITGVLVGTAFVFLGGLADDKFELKAAPQFGIQIGAALIAIATSVFIERVTLPFVGYQVFPWYITYPLTIVWVMGMMNTVNFIDGLDGLAAGVGIIAAILFAFHSFNIGQPEIALYSIALAGACLGFLCFNFSPAKVFLGSAGAMTLGYALATLSILAPARVATALLVMLIPIADGVFQVFDRWRRGQSPTQGDRGHLHYRLQDMGIPQWKIVVGYWIFCAVFGTLALVISSRIYKLIALGVLGVVVIGVLIMLSGKQTPKSQ
jgi:UDP-GlcNAc:undecaprenyl-phosphate/decaprenyl-phosphate GlcNAc-1-phosphate transferase